MRALVWFWATILLVAGAGAGYLQWHGPPPVGAARAAPAAIAASGPRPGPGAVVPVAAPDPLLQEPSTDFAGGFLPRIGPDRRRPADVYAAAAEPSDHRPTVAILLAGLGMSATDSDQAIIDTPAAISLAVSPYTLQPEPLLAEARARGHEVFLSIPMEPKAYPLDDPGNRALLTGNTQAMNAQQLAWAMTRFGGYVGATGTLGDLHGERFADSPTQLGPVLRDLTTRGLLYIDPRPGAALPDGVLGRGVDVLIDEVPGAPEIDASLARLEEIALAHGSALGLVSVPRPVALARLTAWRAGLRDRGLVLLPVSALARGQPPSQKAGP